MFRSSIVALALLTRVSVASAEPIHLRSASSVTTDSGFDLRLPPGYFVDEADWTKLDKEVRRLQDVETQLKAENESLKDSIANGGVGWQIIVGALIVGAAAAMCAMKC